MDESVQKNLKPAVLDYVARRLLAAANLIERKGHWCGGEKESGGTCMVLAIVDAGDGWSGVTVAQARLAKNLGFSEPDLCGQLYRWNDTHSKEEVLAKLRAVALGG